MENMLHFYIAPVIWKHQCLEAGYIGSPICQVQVAEEHLWLIGMPEYPLGQSLVHLSQYTKIAWCTLLNL